MKKTLFYCGLSVFSSFFLIACNDENVANEEYLYTKKSHDITSIDNPHKPVPKEIPALEWISTREGSTNGMGSSLDYFEIVHSDYYDMGILLRERTANFFYNSSILVDGQYNNYVMQIQTRWKNGEWEYILTPEKTDGSGHNLKNYGLIELSDTRDRMVNIPAIYFPYVKDRGREVRVRLIHKNFINSSPSIYDGEGNLGYDRTLVTNWNVDKIASWANPYGHNKPLEDNDNPELNVSTIKVSGNLAYEKDYSSEYTYSYDATNYGYGITEYIPSIGVDINGNCNFRISKIGNDFVNGSGILTVFGTRVNKETKETAYYMAEYKYSLQQQSISISISDRDFDK